jgi:hypothetical protein
MAVAAPGTPGSGSARDAGPCAMVHGWPWSFGALLAPVLTGAAEYSQHERGLRCKGGDCWVPWEWTDDPFCAGGGALGAGRSRRAVGARGRVQPGARQRLPAHRLREPAPREPRLPRRGKDAGDLGAGHSVTALYEIVPAGSAGAPAAKVEPLAYQSGRELTEAAERSELMRVAIRYRDPGAAASELLRQAVADRVRPLDRTSADFRFSSAVAGYGMLLRGSEHKGAATFAMVHELARGAVGADPHGWADSSRRKLSQETSPGRRRRPAARPARSPRARPPPRPRSTSPLPSPRPLLLRSPRRGRGTPPAR